MYLFFIAGILWASCTGTKQIASKPNISDVFLLQNGKTIKIQPNDQKTIAKAPFSLRFYGQRYTEDAPHAVQIAALRDRSAFDKVSVGMPKEVLANFGPATGLAGTSEGYDALFLNDYGHHYLYYKNEQDRRLKLLKKEGDNLFFEFHIPKFYFNDTRYEIHDAPISTVYLVILIDRNSDGIMDAGELTKLVLNLE